MKKTTIAGLLLFVLAVLGVALLSTPRESTWIAMYLDNQRLRRAEELLWKQYRRDPGDLETAARLADILSALKEYPKAKALVAEVVRREPGNLVWKRRLAGILLGEGDIPGATRLLPPEERDRPFWLSLAQAYHGLGEDAPAEEALFARQEEDADQTEAWRTLADWRAERGDADGEKTALRKALDIAPADEELLARYFRNRAGANDLTEALWAAERLPKPLAREHLEALFALYSAHDQYDEARKIAEELVAREDTIPADTLALVSLLYRQNELTEAQTLLDKLAARGDSLGPEAREALAAQMEAVRSALLLEAARKGDEAPLLRALAEAGKAGENAPSPTMLRNLTYACLSLADFYASPRGREAPAGAPGRVPQDAEERAAFWLGEANRLFAANRDRLPLTDAANAHLAADLAERNRDWASMLAIWQGLAESQGEDVRSLLAMARASQHLGDYEAAWRNLHKAQALVSAPADVRAVALQSQAVVRALPPNAPGRALMEREADELARKSLAQEWNDALALNLYYRALESKDLSRAQELLQGMESRGRVSPGDYLGLAEAQVAALARGGNSAALRESARRNALKALQAGVPGSRGRFLHVFTALEDRQQVENLLKRMEASGGPKTAETLRQMAEACGFLGDKERQYALLEQRARLTGQLAHWIDAIDRRMWDGDFKGALSLLDAAEAAHPHDSGLAGRRLIALVDSGEPQKAVRVFQNLKKQDAASSEKLSPASLAALALAYDKSGLPERARHFFNSALAKEPGNARALAGLADLSRRDGRRAEAARLLERALAHDPDNPWAAVELGNLRPGKARQQYEKIIAGGDKAGPGEKAALAIALWRRGKQKEALDLYKELMLDPRRTSAVMCDYAQALIEKDKPGDAKKVLRTAIREFPADVRPRQLLSGIYSREKEYARAEAILKGALRLSPNNFDLLRALADVQQAQRKAWAAKNSWLDAGRR